MFPGCISKLFRPELESWLPQLLTAVALTGAGCLPAFAHPISLTRATAFVQREKMTVSIEVFVEDLVLFQRIEPDERNRLAVRDIKTAMSKHKDFLARDFIVRNVRGDRIEGRAKDVAAAELPVDGVDMRDLMAHTIVYVLEFPLPKPPEYLTISQEFGGGRSAIPAFVTLSVKQEGGAPEPDVELPFGEAQSFRFDWDSPPLAADASRQERDAWFAERQKQQLGLGDFNTTYSFIYIEDFEVRHEILMPLKTLEQWFRIDRRDDEFLEIEEQNAALEPIEQFFAEGNPVEIDGIRVRPVLNRVEFFGLDRRDLARVAQRQRVSAVSARVGVILSYRTMGPPDNVKITWDQYNLHLWTVPAVIYVGDDIRRFEFVQYGEPFEWSSPGREPMPPIQGVSAAAADKPALFWVPAGPLACLVALIMAGAVLMTARARWLSYVATFCVLGGIAAITAPFTMVQVHNPWHRPAAIAEPTAHLIFATLHKNIYRAFDYRRESDIYDALAASVDGKLLSDLYVRIRQGLAMQEQGGAVSRIQAVELVEGTLRPNDWPGNANPRGFSYYCRWQVEGTVEHWGHIHTRLNEYEATFLVEPRHDQWKITRLEVLNEKRVKQRIGVRTLGNT